MMVGHIVVEIHILGIVLGKEQLPILLTQVAIRTKPVALRELDLIKAVIGYSINCPLW